MAKPKNPLQRLQLQNDRNFGKREKVSVQGVTKILLASLAMGAVIGVTLLFPGVGYIYKEFGREKWNKAKSRGMLRGTIRRLEKQKLVSWGEKEGKTVLTLTEKGKKKILRYEFEDLHVKKQNKWDGCFRVVVFDIPENKRDARDTLRRKLLQMGFYKWQRSVFVHPYECKDEVDFLRHHLEVSSYVQYILAKNIPGLKLEIFQF